MSHWGILLFLQVLSAVAVTAQPRGDTLFAALLRLPFLQLQNLAVVVATFSLAFAAAGRVGLRRATLSLAALLSLYATVDQAAYKVLFDRISPGLAAQLGWQSFDSIRALVDGATLPAFVAWGAVYTLLFIRWGSNRSAREYDGRIVALAAALALAAGTASVLRPEHYNNIERHALFALLAGWPTAAAPSSTPTADGDWPMYGSDEPVPPGVAEAFSALRGSGRPNVVLIVLESVGSRQLFDPTSLRRTPALAALATGGVVFDSIYVPYGGTLASNVALQTGGLVSTWTPPWELFDHPYRGPGLASMMSAAGYRTALFAAPDLRYQGLDRFLSQAGYEVFQDFSRLGPGHRVEALNSWGGRDDQMLPLLDGWIARMSSARQPFFLHYMSNAPHHPYNVPIPLGDSSGPADDAEDYRRALQYIDGVVAGIMDALRRHGVAENTLVVVTGDHGESLGVLHPTRRAHFAILTDEVLRSFFIFFRVDAQVSRGLPARIARPGGNGDLLNTIAALIGAPAPGREGDNLFDPAYRPRTHFFHGEHKQPRFWGLRDGRWKYVADSADGPGRLYDLAADPDERDDLAAQHPEQAAAYERLCSAWYARQDRSFVSQFEDAPSPAAARPSTLRAAQVGHWRQEGRFLSFRPVVRVGAGTQMIYRLRWQPERAVDVFEIRWIGPNGVSQVATTERGSLAPEITVPYRGPRPMAAGRWRVETRRVADGVQLDATKFEVISDHPDEPDVPRLRDLAMVTPGLLGASIRKKSFRPGDALGIESAWAPVERGESFEYQLRSPDGQVVSIPFSVPAGQEYRQSVLKPPAAMAVGQWRLTVANNASEVARTEFEVRP